MQASHRDHSAFMSTDGWCSHARSVRVVEKLFIVSCKLLAAESVKESASLTRYDQQVVCVRNESNFGKSADGSTTLN